MTALLLSVANAQDLLPKAAPQRGPVILSNATIHTATGKVILNGTIWFADGKLRGVLPNGQNPRLGRVDAEPVRIDLKGHHVFPGLISAHTSLGLIEIGQVPQSVDTNELGDMSPEAVAATAVNPDSAAIPVARSNGVLAALTAPEAPPSGGISGLAAVIQLDGGTWEDMALEREAALVVEPPSMRFNPALYPPPADALLDEVKRHNADRLRQIDEAFATARAYARSRQADATTPGDLR
ncbi:MAG: hypothetical protein KAI24_19095, partial [Planctomycetes bacterium]|nr:hypothetical protein [Planctomycetota bacterium]